MHQSQLHSIDKLKNRLLDVWHNMDHSVIDDATDMSYNTYTGKRRTLRANVVNLTIALSAKLYDKICCISSNMTFVICRKFELHISKVSAETCSRCGGIYYMGFFISRKLLELES